MESMKQQKVHALSKLKGCHRPVALKGAFQILLSVSLFSLFFLSYPSSTNPRSLKPFLSAFISSHLGFEANRNLMFLLCNAILVFVTGGFGYFRVSSKAVEGVQGDEDKEVIVESLVLVKEVEDGQEEEEEEEAAVADADQENHYHQHHQRQPYHHRHSGPHHQHHHHHQRHRRRRQQRKQQQQHHHPELQLPVQEEEEENENENYRLQQQKQDERGGLVVIEESDERFDNFIKQVREGMRMEAIQLLLTA
ncbi:hypothetical protein ACLOJK_035682 [Asimina triloba]